jgi:uncharacterized protein
MDIPTALHAVLFCGVLYSAGLAILIRFQRLVVLQAYPLPFRGPRSDPLAQGHFVLATDDGERLDAVWLPAETEHLATILYLHGTAANLRIRSGRIKALAEQGFAVLAIDWRGYGRSTGQPSQEGLLRDAEAAFKWLQERAEPSRIVVLGESLGTGVAVEIATRHRVGALVLESPYSSMLDMAKMWVPLFPVEKFLLDQFRSDLLIGKIDTKLLVQHGRRDFTVPFRFGRKLYDLAPEPKRLIVYPKGGHNDLAEKHGSYRDLRRFVVECLSADRSIPA